MRPEERERRIKTKHRKVLAARRMVPAATAEFVAEVEAAHERDGIQYKDIASWLGISRQALLQFRQRANGHSKGPT